MKKLIRLLSLLLIAALLLPACAPEDGPGTTSGSDSDAPTDAPTETTTHPAETDPSDETAAPGDDTGADTEPVTEPDTAAPDTEPETFPDPEPIAYVLPDFVEYETLSAEPGPKTEVHRVEGENYVDKTLSGAPRGGSEFSGGSIFYCNYKPESMQDLYVEYKVTVEQAGTYDLTALVTPSGQVWTCDYWVTVNGGTKKTNPKEYRVLSSFACPTLNDDGVFKVMQMTSVDLVSGENTIRFTIDPNDARDVSFGTTVVLFLDWFELTLGGNTGDGEITVGYAAAPEGEDAELLNGAARVSVYDCRYPIGFTVSAIGTGDKELPWAVTDFYGNKVYSGTLPAGTDKYTLTKAVNKHPTGYFTLTVGKASCSYVVTPPLHTSAFEDSPFAMDFAAYYLIGDAGRTFDVSAAARLMGVTWVRERCDWSTYEPSKGKISFASTDGVYDAIHRAGLNNLAMLCSSPSWARASYAGGNGAGGMIGGFRDHQMDAYNMVKAMAEHYDGIVQAWELWNECDISGFAVEPADLYASWYKAAALAVMDAGVKDTVISFGGLCMGPNTQYMSQLMQNNVLEYSHIFNFHQHATYSGSYTTFIYLLMEYMHASVPAYTDAQKPMWVTEAGMRMNLAAGSGEPTPDQLTGQCSYIVTSTVESLAFGTDKHYWFVLSPYIENGGDFGTFSPNLDPYPTVAAESVMTWVLGDGKYVGDLPDVTKGCAGWMFDTGRGLTSVCWAMQNRAGGFKYSFASDTAVTVTDMMGNRTVVEPVDGRITVTLTRDPIYITYKTAPAFSRQSFPERTIDYSLSVPESGRVILTPIFPEINVPSDKDNGYHVGEYLDLPVRILNLNDHEVSGSVEGTCPGMTVQGVGSVTVPAMSEVTVTVTIQVEGSDAINAYLRLVGRFGTDGGESVSVSHLYTDEPSRKGSIEITNPHADGKKINAGSDTKLTAVYKSVQGEVGVWMNGQPYSDFTVTPDENGGKVTIGTASLTPGRYFASVGVKRENGEYVFDYCVFYIK